MAVDEDDDDLQTLNTRAFWTGDNLSGVRMTEKFLMESREGENDDKFDILNWWEYNFVKY